MQTEQTWIKWYQPGVYAGATKCTMPMTREEGLARFPKFVATAQDRGWRFVRLVTADGTVLMGDN